MMTATKRIGTKFALLGTLALALVFGGSIAANAGTTLLGFNSVVPKFGGTGYSGLQAGTKNVAAAMWVPYNIVDIQVSGYFASN